MNRKVLYVWDGLVAHTTTVRSLFTTRRLMMPQESWIRVPLEEFSRLIVPASFTLGGIYFLEDWYAHDCNASHNLHIWYKITAVTKVSYDYFREVAVTLPHDIFLWSIITVQAEINDRQNFLEEMIALGQGAKYRPIISTEISQVSLGIWSYPDWMRILYSVLCVI